MSESPERPARPTGHDVAARAGVSQATVSLALSDPSSTRVSAATRARIVQIADELGYRPQRAGRALRLGRTGLLLLAVPDVRSTFFARVLHGAQRAAEEAGASVVLASGWSGRQVSEAVAGARFDGAILCSPTDGMLRGDLGATPVVLVDADPHTSGVERVITLDVAEGMNLLVSHARRLGHVRVGRLESSIASHTFRARQLAFDVAAQDLDVVRAPVDLEQGVSGSAAAAGFLLDLPDPPTVILCDDDVIAAGVYHAARVRGLSIPGDVGVLGMDDSPTARLLDPPLSTISFPAEDLGAAGVRAVLDAAAPVAAVAPPRIVIRGSVTRVRVG